MKQAEADRLTFGGPLFNVSVRKNSNFSLHFSNKQEELSPLQGYNRNKENMER